jgi:hypothetical protein
MVPVSEAAEDAVVGIAWPRNRIVDPVPKFVPVTWIVCPAATVAGVIDLMTGPVGPSTLNRTAPDVPPPGVGFVTVMSIPPACPSSDAGRVAVREVDELKTVANRVEPTMADEFPANPVPVNCTVTSTGIGSSGVRRGFNPLNVGAALVIVNTPPAAAPPPGAGFVTPICTVPERCRKPSVSVPVNCPADTNCVGTGVPSSVI